MSRMRLTVSAAPRQFEKAMTGIQQTAARAATAAVREAARQVQERGRQEMASAGLSRRWQTGFRATVTPKTGTSLNATLLARSRLGYASIFETGGTIRGKPLLWVPLSSAPAKIGGRRITPRLYTEKVGPLFRITRAGKPPLLAGQALRNAGPRPTVAQLKTGSRNVASRRGGGRSRRVRAVPIFVGVPSVHIAKRLNIRQVYEAAFRGLEADYQRHLKGGNNGR